MATPQANTPTPWSPQRDILSAKTFNCLSRPDKEWVWGNAALIDSAGCYGEDFASFLGAPEAVAALAQMVLQTIEHNAKAQYRQDEVLSETFAVGVWKGSKSKDLIVFMGIRGQTLLSISTLRLTHADLFTPLTALTHDEQLLDGASDTFWGLVDQGVDHPEHQNACFDLAYKLMVEKDDLDSFVSGPKSSALVAWISVQALQSATPEVPQSQKELAVNRRV